jgi:hypothetical protein
MSMAETILRQVRLTREEDEWLQRWARDRGVSEEDLIREAVRQMLAEAEQGADQKREEARGAWEQVLALMRGRAHRALPPEEQGTGRGWTREEIYDDREEYLAR